MTAPTAPPTPAPRPASPRSRTHVGTILRAAGRQLRIELRVQFLSPMVLSWLITPGIGLLILSFLRDVDVMDSAVNLAQLGIPGILTMTLVTSGLLGICGQLITERDDGTLLRAKAVPGGIMARLLGDLLVTMCTSLGPMLLLLAAAVLIVDGVAPASPMAWWTLLWVSVLGLFATLPFGAILGALLRDTTLLWIVALVVYALLAISGVFYPLAALPGWLQAVGRALPVYWVGLGLRHALLPPDAVALEIGSSWQSPQTALVLAGWAVLGLVLAPLALRRMARHQSGSRIAAARDRVLARGY